MKSADDLVRHFAVSEAVFRGTALAANLILISIVATEKNFGSEGVLMSAFIQISISGLLEIPTGRFADRSGWYSSVRLGLGLKVATTLCYVAAVLCVRFAGAAWAWLFIAVESIIDSFANAFISGAYQAAYSHWYEHHLARGGLSKAEAPPLFLASFRYGLRIRVLLPVAALVLGTVIFHFLEGGEGAFIVYLGLLCFILVLRLVVILRTRADLQPLAALQREAAASGGDRRTPLREIAGSRFESLALYGFATLLTVACGFYLYGEIYRSLSALVPGVGLLWLGGTMIGLSINIGGVLLSRAFAERAQAASDAQVKRGLPAMIGVLSLLSLAALRLSGSQALHIAVLFGFSLIAMTAGSVIQRCIASRESDLLAPSIRATWFSLGEVVGLLAFGLLAGLSLLSGVPRAGLWVLLFAVGLAGLGFGCGSRTAGS